MVLNTLTVGAAVTPAVIKTYLSHYTNRKPLRQKPTAHISYHEGLNLIRQFLHYASHHTVEEIQAFTGQWVPNPRWVKSDRVTIPQKQIDEAAELLIAQLGEHGVNRVGGKKWWQWRYKGHELEAEWIEMRNDYNARMRKELDGRRIMLYVHGGAYFFGSTDEHRYQMQRHARKLRARVLAPRYRLAPQFPFPCGLQDCISAYLYLLTLHNPNDIILAGDSAGAGMVVSLLVILRDQGISLPAGAILISPWVDLTHSFPSLCGSDEFDYIPSHGFMQRPSPAWPPPNDDEMEALAEKVIASRAGAALPRKSTQAERKHEEEAAIQGFAVYHHPSGTAEEASIDTSNILGKEEIPIHNVPGPGRQLSIMIDGSLVQLKDQIQMWGELLRDEQIYLAHKAANPTKYPPSEAYLDEHDPDRTILNKYKPTDVQIQVWDDLCHVAPTLSFTRPAKFMYRSVAQFGAWALARAQKAAIEIMDDDQVSIISSGSDTASESDDVRESKKTKTNGLHTTEEREVGKAGDPLPNFHNHMIRQRVDRHGAIYPLAAESDLPALQMQPDEIGVIKKGPVQKWMIAKKQWDGKYATAKRQIQKQRLKEMLHGHEDFGHEEVPPPSALAGRRTKADLAMPKKPKKSIGLMLWTLWGSHHDENALEREAKMDAHGAKETDITTVTGNQEGTETTTTNRPRAQSGAARLVPPSGDRPGPGSRSRSRKRVVSDVGQTDVSNIPLIGIDGASSDAIGQDQSAQPNEPYSPMREASLDEYGHRPTNKLIAALRPTSPRGPKSPDNVSLLSFSTTAPASDAASTTAVFAAPGVLGRARNGTTSTVGSVSPSINGVDGAHDQADPETSRRGSVTSVERLRQHQVPQEGESDKDMSAANGGMSRLALSRNVSSVAVKGVEGVLKPEKDNDPGSEETTAPNGVDGERPGMPNRDEFVTAQEI